MRNTRRLVLIGFALGFAGMGRAEAREAAAVPQPLRPWVGWVLGGDDGKNAACLARTGESEPLCAWPSRLHLDVGDHGGGFRQEWTLFKAGFVPLPGNKEHWPRNVRLDGRLVPMADSNNEAQIAVPPGRHVITGRFVWDSLPESVQAPKETGLVSLAVNGTAIDFPARDGDGRVFCGRAVEVAEEDKVDVSVYRKLLDASPMLLTTRLVLAVSGKSRELLLGKALPASFSAFAVDSPLPVRFDNQGHVRVQVRRGSWTIDIRAQASQAEAIVERPRPDGFWKDGSEIWAFEARPDLRMVSVEGVPSIDPAQTLLPGEWKGFPAYLMAPEAKLSLVEKQRGYVAPPPEQLSLERMLWLDADGGGLSAHDEVAGGLTRSSRLEVQDQTRPGRVSIEHLDQFITRVGDGGKTGIEIRNRFARIEADSRIEPRMLAVPAVGFAHAFEKVSTTLNVPVGWELFHVAGADRVTGTWIGRWSVGDLVLGTLVVLLATYLFGPRTGLLTLIVLVMTLVDPKSPDGLWLLVLAAEVLARALPAGNALVAARVARVLAWAVMVVASWPFLVEQAKLAVHPSAAATSSSSEARFVNFLVKPPEEMTASLANGYNVGDLVGLHTLGMGAGAAPEGMLLGMSGSVRHKGAEGKAGHSGGYARHQAGLRAPASPPKADEYDPSIVVQTGPGLPRWMGKQATWTFDGTVASDQQVRLFLAPPWLNRGVAAVKVVLLCLLAWLFLRRPLRVRGAWHPPTPLLAGIVSLLLLCPLAASAAEQPSREVLDELKERLLQKPECAPDCASVNDMTVDVAPRQLRIVLQVSAVAPTPIALPGDLTAWSPTVVLVDGKPSPTLVRGDEGHLWAAIEPGLHAVEVAGPLPNRDNIQLALPSRPHHASCKARGFLVSGIHEDGAVDESILLSREATTTVDAEDTVAALSLPPFLRVTRTLVLGLKWEVHTEVTRESSAGTPVVAEIPLLPGESVTTAGIRTEKSRGTVSVDMGPQDSHVAWESTLAERPELRLRAEPANASRWAETWRADVGPLWHASFSGIPPVRPDSLQSRQIPEWAPRPGEEVRIAVEKPKGVPGQTLTIDASNLAVEIGTRSLTANLSIELRSSRGTEHGITLPAGADLTKLERDNIAETPRQEGRELRLSIPPGRHTFDIGWRQMATGTLLTSVPPVDLHMPSANATVAMLFSQKARWVLWLAGPGNGPVVGLWAWLAVLMVVAFVLARQSTPLRAHQWLVLCLGLTQSELLPALLVPAAILALGWRARTQSPCRAVLYNVGQIAIVVLMVGGVSAWVNVADNGLSRIPDMLVLGSGAVAPMSWYQDRVSGVLPQPWMLSAPVWAYRVLMAGWVLWSIALGLRCTGWARQAITRHGLWLSTEPVPPQS